MKKLFIKFIAIILVYLVFSFCAWQFNPGHWGGFWRLLWVVISAIIVFDTEIE